MAVPFCRRMKCCWRACKLSRRCTVVFSGLYSGLPLCFRGILGMKMFCFLKALFRRPFVELIYFGVSSFFKLNHKKWNHQNLKIVWKVRELDHFQKHFWYEINLLTIKAIGFVVLCSPFSEREKVVQRPMTNGCQEKQLQFYLITYILTPIWFRFSSYSSSCDSNTVPSDDWQIYFGHWQPGLECRWRFYTLFRDLSQIPHAPWSSIALRRWMVDDGKISHRLRVHTLLRSTGSAYRSPVSKCMPHTRQTLESGQTRQIMKAFWLNNMVRSQNSLLVFGARRGAFPELWIGSSVYSLTRDYKIRTAPRQKSQRVQWTGEWLRGIQ